MKATLSAVSAIFLLGFAQHVAPAEGPRKLTFEQFLRESAVSRETIDRFLRGPSWARFDPEVGYVLGNYLPVDGVDGSATISTIQPNGARRSFLYTSGKCRINTYGDSFTQCHQVSDGETWQEYLAAHLGEPIGNFGMGGFGVYQAYRRMLREEKASHGAEYIILYIWGDDHIRSLLRCRHAITYRGWNSQGGRQFHGNPWANVEMDLENGTLVEKESLLPTPQSLYRMTEPQWMVDHLKEDLALQMYAFKNGYIRDLDRKRISRLAARLGYPLDWSRESELQRQTGGLLDKYSLHATRFILDKARAFADRNRKKLLIILFDPYRAMAEARDGKARYDQEIVDYLAKEGFNYFDMNEVHLRDFKQFQLPFQEYMKRYFVGGRGHYSPAGNHFFAYSLKGKVVEWLDPKPVPYRRIGVESVDFSGYLPRSY